MKQLDAAACQTIDGVFAVWNERRSPGAALVLTQGDDVVYMRGYGASNLEYDVPIGEDTVFHVASVSKQFTTAAILLLSEDERLDLDDEVRSHLPWLPDYGPRITLRHLVHHSSGIRDQWELLRWAGWRMDDVITQDHLLKVIGRQGSLNFAPGDEYLYSNSGYTLLAEVVDKVSGRSLRELARERIFEPLGMARSMFFADHEEIVPGRAYSYAPLSCAPGRFKKSVLSFSNIGATSLFTTARDLGRWLLHLRRIEGTTLAASLQQRLVLNSGEVHHYAGGLNVTEYRGLRLVGHSGSDAGYRSYCGRFVDHGLGIGILCNLSTMEPVKLAHRVAEILLGEHMQPAPAVPLPVDPATAGMDRAAYPGRYIVAESGLPVVVSWLDGELRLQLGELAPLPLLPTGLHRFYAPAVQAEVTFERPDESGLAPSLVAPVYRDKAMARRVLASPVPEQAAVYAGDYYSAELDTTYRLRLVSGSLRLQHQRIPDTPLLRVGPGEFAVDRPGGGCLRFDADLGPAAGFRLEGTRCRRLVFSRVG